LWSDVFPAIVLRTTADGDIPCVIVAGGCDAIIRDLAGVIADQDAASVVCDAQRTRAAIFPNSMSKWNTPPNTDAIHERVPLPAG
jgi:hypothetical protein